MAQAWQTVEEAAVTLGISTRTLHRRMSKGEFETRMNGNRREVLVTVEDPIEVPTNGPAFSSAPIGAEMEQSAPQAERLNGEGESNSTELAITRLTLTEDRLRRTDLAILAYQQSVMTAATEARRARIGSRVAWGTAGGVLVCLALTITWATHRLTAAEGSVRQLTDEVRRASQIAETKEQEAERLRREAEAARLQAARAEGELKATLGQLERQEAELKEARTVREVQPPTTQPASIVDRMRDMLSLR